MATLLAGSFCFFFSFLFAHSPWSRTHIVWGPVMHPQQSEDVQLHHACTFLRRPRRGLGRCFVPASCPEGTAIPSGTCCQLQESQCNLLCSGHGVRGSCIKALAGWSATAATAGAMFAAHLAARRLAGVGWLLLLVDVACGRVDVFTSLCASSAATCPLWEFLCWGITAARHLPQIAG